MAKCEMEFCGVDERPVDMCPTCKNVYCEPHMDNHFCSAGTIIVIDEFGCVFQLERELSQSELDTNFRGESTILRLKNGVVEELNSMDQSEWTELEQRG